MFQKDLNSDLKKEPDLKSRYFFPLLWTDLTPNVGKYASTCVPLWIYIKHNVPNKAGTLKLPKYYVQRLEYTWA